MRTRQYAPDALEIAADLVSCAVWISPRMAACTGMTIDFSILNDDPLLDPDIALEQVRHWTWA